MHRYLVCTLFILHTLTSVFPHAKPRVKKQSQKFSSMFAHVIPDYVHEMRQSSDSYFWQHEDGVKPFNELIFSWNGHRPKQGKFTFWVSVKHGGGWSSWHRIAEWGKNHQRSFINRKNPYVHTKHVRVELQKGVKAKGFRVKVSAEGGADVKNLKALFACSSDLKHFPHPEYAFNMPSVSIGNVPKQSQMKLAHPRCRDLCSPTSSMMVLKYLLHKAYGCVLPRCLHNQTINFADKVHDKGIDIYGNWLLNVAQVYDSSQGKLLCGVGRLNGFKDLYQYLKQSIPVAVSVRNLTGGATPYENGHFMVVIGWDQAKRSVVCIDPAFDANRATLKSYKLGNFLRSWARSRNLSYIATPVKDFYSRFSDQGLSTLW